MDDKFFLSLVDKFNLTAATELEFSDGNTRLTLRKETAGSCHTAAPAASSGEPSFHHGISSHAVPVLNTAAEVHGREKITSPIVATFYSSPGPDAPPFVKIGSKVKTGQTLCILEAMKMMNHLEAEYDCEITEIHSLSGELVEYGQTLFTVSKK